MPKKCVSSFDDWNKLRSSDRFCESNSLQGINENNDNLLPHIDGASVGNKDVYWGKKPHHSRRNEKKLSQKNEAKTQGIGT